MNNKFLKNVFKVLCGNIITIISGVLIGFLLPMLISVTDYGYYKIFTLYMSYIGCFALGIIDGINLKYAGSKLDELNKKDFRLYFKVITIIQLIVSILVILFSFIFLKDNLRVIFILLGLIIIPNNLSGYFQQVSQATQRFSEYAIRNIVKSLGNIVILFILFILYKANYEVTYVHYIVMFLFINYFLFGWYIATYKEIVFGKYTKAKDKKLEIIEFIKMGFPLMISNLCATLILTIDRQFVSILFSTEEYAQYAFAYNLLSLVTIAISAIAVVLFPMLKQESEENLSKKYDKYISSIIVTVGLMLVSYFPLSLIINMVLPKYNESLIFFKIIFPSLLGSSALTAIMHNYYKSIGKNILFFKKSIVILVISIIANIIAYVISKSMVGFSVATIIVTITWYIYTEHTLVEKLNVKWKKNLIYQILIIIIFYISIMCNENIFISAVIYIILFAIISYIMQKEIIKSLLNRLINRKKQ